MQTLQICDFVHDYYTCAVCVYTNALCPVMHMSVSCPCVCRRCADLCAAVLHSPCYFFLVPSIPLFSSLSLGPIVYFIVLQLYFFYFFCSFTVVLDHFSAGTPHKHTHLSSSPQSLVILATVGGKVVHVVGEAWRLIFPFCVLFLVLLSSDMRVCSVWSGSPIMLISCVL